MQTTIQAFKVKLSTLTAAENSNKCFAISTENHQTGSCGIP
jgi:hypothetical protein